MVRARDLLQSSDDDAVTVREVAARVGLSPCHVIRTFAARFGDTPHQVRTRARIERAQALLAAGVTVTTACVEVGFSSLGSFSLPFQRWIGAPSGSAGHKETCGTARGGGGRHAPSGEHGTTSKSYRGPHASWHASVVHPAGHPSSHADAGAGAAGAGTGSRSIPRRPTRRRRRAKAELSCANNRFFRRTLYPEPRINRVLRERFVLHWESVRPVPIVTIDFGNGTKLVKPITGNSVHLVLDMYGRPVDALPGLVTPDVFLQQLEIGYALSRVDRKQLAAEHARLMRVPRPAAQPSRAVAASRIAMTKHGVEMPLRAVSPPIVETDTAVNLERQARTRWTFANNTQWAIEALVAWIYRDIFLMPPEDPMLGLDVPDPV